MVRKFNKRGQEGDIYFKIFEVIAAAMVIIVIFAAIRGIVNNSNYWKRYYSTDLALSTEIASTNQGDFVLNYALKEPPKTILAKIYQISTKPYEIALLNDHVQVYANPKDEDKHPQSFPFAQSRYIDIIQSSIISNFVVLSKTGTDLTIDSFYSSGATTCPSFVTKKDMNYLKFNSTSIPDISGDKTKAYATSMKAMLSLYGKEPGSVKEANILFYYQKGATFTIYYSDDQNILRSQKLACLIGEAYIDDARFSSGDYEIKKYDGFLDDNKKFSDYVSSKDTRELWVIVVMSDEEFKVTQNELAQILYKGILNYYE